MYIPPSLHDQVKTSEEKKKRNKKRKVSKWKMEGRKETRKGISRKKGIWVRDEGRQEKKTMEM